MIVIPHKRVLLLRVRDPAPVRVLIPTCKDITIRGKKFLAVPFTLKNMRRLRTLQIASPSPVKYFYEWPRNKYAIAAPFHAQVETASFLSLHYRAFVLNGLGSGKSLASLWAYDYLRSRGKANKLLVVCPLSTVDLTWADTIYEHLPHLDVVVLHASNKAQRRKLLAMSADIYVVNHHGVGLLEDDLNKRPDIDIVIVDEIAQCARNAQTKMWKALNRVVNAPGINRTSWGLTATPIPNSPVDAYGQAKLLVPDNVPRRFTQFRDQVMRQQGPFLWLPRPNALEVAHAALSPSIRFSREECVDLPPTTYTDIVAALSVEQTKAYKEMLRKLAAELEAGEITAANEAVKLGKLVQIAAGCAYDSRGNEIRLPCSDRLAQMEQLVQDSHSKTIVFAPFVSVVKMLHQHLTNAGYSAEMIYGDVSKTKRQEVFHAFQRGEHPQVLVAQPSAMSHGLTLTASSTIIWYAPITSADTYAQANGRITRPGQKFNTLIAHISATDEERRIYARLRKKERMQGVLLEQIKNARK